MAAVDLVVSDVDGTLVTPDKRLTDASRRAVAGLAEAGIGFTITSSRPPFGLASLVEPLGLTLPIGAFNGGMIVTPDLRPIELHMIAPDVAAEAIGWLDRHGVEVWVFTADAWLLQDPAGLNVERERRAVQAEPTTVADFAGLSGVGKIVGVSNDRDRLAACEAALGATLGSGASVARSQPYYLDVTAPGIDKGTFVAALSKRLGIPPERIATIGDMDNDVAMFRHSGLSIAMGNAPDAVKAKAGATTAANTDEGFAAAIEQIVLAGR
jgi:Cof subfamily protein (haloacid dehalogenase superfamily)